MGELKSYSPCVIVIEGSVVVGVAVERRLTVSLVVLVIAATVVRLGRRL